jgi:hypothetical protein
MSGSFAHKGKRSTKLFRREDLRAIRRDVRTYEDMKKLVDAGLTWPRDYPTSARPGIAFDPAVTWHFPDKVFPAGKYSALLCHLPGNRFYRHKCIALLLLTGQNGSYNILLLF